MGSAVRPDLQFGFVQESTPMTDFLSPDTPFDTPRTESERQLRNSTSLSGTNLERAGDYNQRVTLQAIRIRGLVTRAELARITGLTAPAIANITKRLLQEGLITEAGRRTGGRGQPAMKLTINPDGCVSIGANIDRDHITVLLLDLQGRVRARRSREAELGGPEEAAQIVRDMTDQLLIEAQSTFSGAIGPKMIGAGVALPDDLGRIRLPAGHVEDAWRTVDVHKLFGKILPGPVFIENDAAAAAIGELQFGHGVDVESFFYILISAGLGGGLVVEGDYFRGANGRSGEIGFLPIQSDRTQARSLQEAVSLSALYADLAAKGVHISTPEQLDHLDEAGEALISAWLDTAAELLTIPLLSVVWLVNPAAILLGGRLPGRLMDDLAVRLNARLAQAAPDAPTLAPVRRALTSADAPAIGAAILPFLNRLLPSRANLMKTAEVHYS
jgi:predicted NBD/HSP70 family sugar kinase